MFFDRSVPRCVCVCACVRVCVCVCVFIFFGSWDRLCLLTPKHLSGVELLKESRRGRCDGNQCIWQSIYIW